MIFVHFFYPNHYMKKRFASFIICLMVLAAGCTETTDIGSNLINESDFPDTQVFDTITMQVNTIRVDSIQTAPPLTGIPYMLGKLNDPVTGSTAMGIFTQFVLPTNNINLGDSLRLDSIVLTLRYGNQTVYGQKDLPVSLTVYELTQEMLPGVTYYSNKSFAYNPNPIGYKNNFFFSPTDSVLLFNKKLKDVNGNDSLVYIKTEPHLRIRLANELGNRLLAQSGTFTFTDKNSFQQFFKGVYISASTNGNAVAFFDLLAARSRLSVYFSRGTLAPNLVIDFPIGTLSATNNYFVHDYAGSSVADVIAAPSPNSQTTAYVKGAAGLGFSLRFPYFDAFKDYAINKAELEFTALPNTFELYKLPSSLNLVSYDTINEQITRLITSTNVQEIDGPNGEKLNQYKLIFSFYAQQKLNGLIPDAIEKVLVDLQRTNPNIAVIGGPEHPDYPMKFRIYGTKLQ